VKAPSIERVRGPYPLADDDPRWRHGPQAVLEAALRAGVSCVQLRMKHTSDRAALELASWAATRARDAAALLIVNDRFDLADLAGADGVHLGQDDLPPERIPEKVRERLVVGLSTHTLEQVKESRDRPVDYIGFGPVFGTASKESQYAPRSVEALSEAVRIARHPVVAIGGITVENVDRVRRAGARGFAVISAVSDADDPETALRELGRRFSEATG
jgi:thiamine-phosphate pyrophosphorylase